MTCVTSVAGRKDTNEPLTVMSSSLYTAVQDGVPNIK